MIWKTAWKNVWRKKTRSLIIIISVAIGVFAGVFTIALMNGLIIQRIDSALNTEISHIQINHSKFRSNTDIQFSLSNSDSITNSLSEISNIKSITRRTVIAGMINSTQKNSGVQIIGINPEEETSVFNLNDYSIKSTGEYFKPDNNKKNLAFIGEALAKELNIIRYNLKTEHLEKLKTKEVPEDIILKLKPIIKKRFKNEKLFKKALRKALTEDEFLEHEKTIINTAKDFRKRARLILTFLDKENNQTGGSFRIAGLYNLSNNMFERTQVFVLNSDIKPLAGIDKDEYHQIIVKLNDTDSTDISLNEIRSRLPNLEVKGWKEISPELAMTTDMVKQFYAAFMLIILAALAFGILNTMLMVVLERTKELGMLTAIGMNKKRVFSMIMLESIFLSLIGGVFGMVFSSGVIKLTSRSGIDLSSYAESFEEMGYTSHIFPEIDNEFFAVVAIMIIITGILSAIYPAIKALKLNPADAIRSE